MIPNEFFWWNQSYVETGMKTVSKNGPLKVATVWNALYLRLFDVFESLLFSPRLHLFGKKYSKISNIVKYYYN